MSQSPHHESHRSSQHDAGFRRDCWWGEDVDGTDTDDQRVGHDPDEFDYASELAAYVAHDYLKNTATLLCPVALFETPSLEGGRTQQLFAFLYDEECLEHNELAVHEENREVEISDPEVRMPNRASEQVAGRDYGVQRYRRRFNDEDGYITGPYIADRPEPEFMDAVDDLLEWWQQVESLRDREVAQLRRDARRLKQRGDMRDVDIVETLLEDVIADEPIC